MRKIPSVFVRRERSSLVDITQVTVGCEWVFDANSAIIFTIKHDGTPVRYNDGAWYQRRTLKSRLDPGVDGIPKPLNFEPCQPVPEYDDESKQWEWPGWVPLDSQYKKLVEEAVISRGGMKASDDGSTFELCGPKVNGNLEGWDTHHLFLHGSEAIILRGKEALSVENLIEMVTALQQEGIVLYNSNVVVDRYVQTAKLKRRDLGLDWPIKVSQKIDL